MMLIRVIRGLCLCWVVMCLWLIGVSVITAQASPPTRDTLLFVWNNTLIAQTLVDNEIITPDYRFTGDQALPPTRYGNVFSYRASPLQTPPRDNYGFYQGVWSSEVGSSEVGSTEIATAESAVTPYFAFLAIQPNDAGYHVILLENGQQRLLFSDTISPERGYLVPVGWSQDGMLMLLERHTLHTLREVKLWQFHLADATLTLRHTVSIPELKGNSASLADGWVFVGFDTVGVLGYLVNINNGQMRRFATSFALQDPPASVFETYPIQVVSVADQAEFDAWLAQNPTISTPDSPKLTTPFLYWMLPDYARSITCYPDSDWTSAVFAVECPGLTVPREYQGHEGTDIGGKPNGLAIGTEVYAAAPGIVVKRFTECAPQDITCGDAYGNYVLLEHARVIDYEVETWFTGYAHLQTVLIEPNTYIRELGLPIALSGETGLGGAHLHFEVRSPQHPTHTNWLDPWDVRLSTGTTGLWITTADSASPESAVIAFPSPTLMTCQTINDNNIRSGPGTAYDLVAKSLAEITYEVFQVQPITNAATPGDWYHVRWSGSDATGWIWAELMTVCTPVTP